MGTLSSMAINTSAEPFLTVEESKPIIGVPILVYGASVFEGCGNKLVENLIHHVDFDKNTLCYSEDFAFTDEFIKKLHTSKSEKIYLNYAIKYGIVVFIIDEYSHIKKGTLKSLVHKMLDPHHTETQYVFYVSEKCRLAYQKSKEVQEMYTKGYFGYDPTNLNSVVEKIKNLYAVKVASTQRKNSRVPSMM